ncbi:hypothetical protein FA95DRAFT_1123853 [Auriscalpium vulgare]|uniref:Uncharacterized protein n=1 Tax=Auriscalpium vulgare TaxID=40419 RepID=A0ACB8RV43_9AGAM|nr:hypothetical protein FA95DRAFT_1123853 [Auriscalpium vulgare]
MWITVIHTSGCHNMSQDIYLDCDFIQAKYNLRGMRVGDHASSHSLQLGSRIDNQMKRYVDKEGDRWCIFYSGAGSAPYNSWQSCGLERVAFLSGPPPFKSRCHCRFICPGRLSASEPTESRRLNDEGVAGGPPRSPFFHADNEVTSFVHHSRAPP